MAYFTLQRIEGMGVPGYHTIRYSVIENMFKKIIEFVTRVEINVVLIHCNIVCPKKLHSCL